jgi:hypothetical protein
MSPNPSPQRGYGCGVHKGGGGGGGKERASKMKRRKLDIKEVRRAPPPLNIWAGDFLAGKEARHSRYALSHPLFLSSTRGGGGSERLKRGGPC